MANLIRRDNREATRGTTPEPRVDPFRVVDALLRWDPYRGGDWSGVASGTEFAPRFDVKEVKDAYIIKADLPGVKDADLEVALNGNILTVSGRLEEEQREEGEAYYAMERVHGSFARSFTLPESVESSGVTAELKDGVLTVRIPKKPEAQPKRIPIAKGSENGSENKAKA